MIFGWIFFDIYIYIPDRHGLDRFGWDGRILLDGWDGWMVLWTERPGVFSLYPFGYLVSFAILSYFCLGVCKDQVLASLPLC